MKDKESWGAQKRLHTLCTLKSRKKRQQLGVRTSDRETKLTDPKDVESLGSHAWMIEQAGAADQS